MAESEFSIDIPVNLSLTQARAELRQFLEEASRGVSVPLRGGGAPGAGPQSAAESVAVAEQRAVASAMDRAQGESSARFTPAGTYRLPGGYTPQPGYGRATLPDVYPGMGRPIESRIAESAARINNMSTQLAEARAMQQAAPAAEVLPVPGGAGGRGAGGGSRAGRVSSWLGANSVRGIFGLLATSEINNALGAVRGADVAERAARTPEEAFLARAQANEQATSGLIGGAVALIPNLLDLPGAPQRALREAQEANAFRNIRDQTRQQQNATAANVAYRSGYAVGGRSQAEIARIEAVRRGETSTLNSEILDLQAKLSERTPIGTTRAYATPVGAGGTYTTGGEFSLTGEARTTAQQQLKERTDRLADTNAQAKFDTEQKKREEATFLRQSTAAESTSRMTARGATSRALERQALSDQYTEAREKAVDLFGAAGGARVDRERDAAFGALEFNNQRQDDDFTRSLNLATQVQWLQNTNQPVAAAITAAVGQSSAQARNVFRAGFAGRGIVSGIGGMARQLAAIGGNLAANVAAPLIQEQQTVYQQQQGIVGQAAVLQMQLDRNPLGAQLAGIAAQRDAYLNSQQFQSLSPAAQGRLRPIVQGYAELQERYARQQDRDRRFEIGDSLDAANRQSRLRQAGGDYRVDAVLDRIVTDTARDARQLERDRDPNNAVKRRTLGVNQLREARGDYFRSINFEEVEGGRIAAGRDRPFDAVERKFRDAEDRIGKSKDGGPAGGGGPPTSGQMTTLIGLIQQFVNRNFVARTGP